MAGPAGEQIVSILGAEITILKEQRLCVKTKPGGVFLWREYHPQLAKLNPVGTQPTRTWRQLKPLPDGQEITELIVSQFDADEFRPVLVVKSNKGEAYGWMGNDWSPFYGIKAAGVEWPEEWSNYAGPKHEREFRSWFAVPPPPGKAVDEKEISFEGALSWWVTCYALLDNGHLMVLAAETDVVDVMCKLVGVVVGLLAGIVLLIILGVRRRRESRRRLEASCPKEVG